MSRRGVDLCETPLFKGIIVYTIPIILTGILQLLFNAADLIVLGQFCGSNAVGAVGATGVMVNLLVNMFIGLSSGTGVTMAYALGAKDNRDAQSIVHTAIPLAILIGAVLTVVGFVFTPMILTLLCVPEELIGQSTVYARLYFAGTVFNLVYNFGAALLRAAGNTREPLIYLSIAGCINVVFNLFFVLVLKMNVAGVAIATVISQAVSALLVLRNLCTRYDACRLTLKNMRIRKKPLKRILSFGVPAGLQSLAFSISNSVIQSALNTFGTAAVSGMAGASSISTFLYTAQNAFFHTTMNFTGQNMGARKAKRVTGTLWRALLCVSVVGITGGVLIYVFRYPLLSIYLTDSPEAIEYASIRLLYTCLPYFLCGTMEVGIGALRGIGSAVASMILSLAGSCVLRILWIYTLFRIPAFHTIEWALLSYPVSWGLMTIAVVIAFAILWKKKKPALLTQQAGDAL